MSTDEANSHKPLLVVPDVHLRLGELRSLLDAWSGSGPVVFLGDFFDDFGDTPDRNREMAEFLRDEVLPNPDYTVLVGNHDLHYNPRCPSELWCSGFHPDKKEAIGRVLGDEDFARFKWAFSRGGTLFTHAGLHPRLIPPHSTGRAEELAEWIERSCAVAMETRDSSEPLLRAGRMRGGYQPVGGVIWMDAREYQPIEGLRQIFGHTPMREPMDLDSRAGGSWCIDTNLQVVGVIPPDGGEIRIVKTRGASRETLLEEGGKALVKVRRTGAGSVETSQRGGIC